MTEGRAFNTENNTKVLVLMTDGQNTYIRTANSRSHGTTYTATWSATILARPRPRLYATRFMDQRTLQICHNIKAAEHHHTVAFQIPGDQAAALDLLNSCASDRNKYFPPGTNPELLDAFTAIGRDITELRVTQQQLLLLLALGCGLTDRLFVVIDRRQPQDVGRIAYHERWRNTARNARSRCAAADIVTEPVRGS